MRSDIPTSRQNPFFFLLILVLIWMSLFLVRWTAPSDLLDKDQERPAAYMADAALNGNWIVQVDDHGRVCSKPPVYTWLGAGLILLMGKINAFALYFPSALGVLGCCILIWYFGGPRFGYPAAFLGASFLLFSSIGVRILYLARTDALFSFATFLTACVGYGCRCRNWNWIWFWLAAALSTLTKGPLGLVLAAGGLIGLIRSAPPAGDQSYKSHVSGVLLYLILCAGWFWLAYLQLGDAVIDKLIGRELYGHTNWRSDRFSLSYFFFITPFLFFLSRFFPWSIAAISGLWQVWKRPAVDADARCFERFIASYLGCGILLFSVFPHQRADHLFPLLPAAGLLAGREVIRWASKRKLERYVLPSVLGFWLLFAVGFGVYYFKIDPATNPWFARTAGVQQLAARLETRIDTKDHLYFVDTPYGFQFHLNTMKQRITYEEAARLLSGDEAVIVSIRSMEALKKCLPPTVTLHMVIRWPETGKGFIFVVSNRAIQM
jgi:4-amino-4-deoxy-L-arabinose transferase-like glycosyltransferase